MKSLLPDAMIVIALHEHGLWDRLVSRTTVVVPSIVLHDEVRFYLDPRTGQRTEIDLEAELAAGRIEEAEATLECMQAFKSQFDMLTQEGLHPGELEALAILDADVSGDMRFCTADRTAVRAMVLARLEVGGISLEAALGYCGIGFGQLKDHFGQRRFQEWVDRALSERLQRTDWDKL